MSPPGGDTLQMKRGSPGSLSPAAFSSSPMTSPAGYYNSTGYKASNNGNSSSRSPSPMQQQKQQRLVDASAAVKGVYGPILEEQQTLTETCSWSGSVDSGGGGFIAPGRMVCSTPVSSCISPVPGSTHPHNNPHWLRNVFRVAASKALGKTKTHQPGSTAGQPQAVNQNHYLQQQQQQQQQYQQQQQMAPGALNSWDIRQQQQHQEQQQQQMPASWWKPKTKQCLTLTHRPITPEMTVRPRSVSPAQVRPHTTSPVSTNVLPLAGSVYRTAQQYNSWSAQGATQGGSTKYPMPQYEEQQQQQQQLQQQVRQLSMQLPMPPQPFQQQQQQQQMVFTRTTHGPFAQTETQQAVLGQTGHRHNNPTDPAAAAHMNPDTELESAASGNSVGESSACPQVVNASSGQVLKVSSGEFQDILTVMQALADARKSLAVRLNVSETGLHSQHDVVAAAAAKMAAAAAATTTATAHTAPFASSQQQEQQQQQQDVQRDARQHPTAAAEDAPTALDVEASTEDAGYRVNSCTVKGFVPSERSAAASGPSSYPLADGQLLSNVSAADAAEAIWQQQQQQQQQSLWAQPASAAAAAAAAAAAGEGRSLVDSTTRSPLLLNTSLTGEQHASAIDLAADAAADYSIAALGGTGAAGDTGTTGSTYASGRVDRQDAQVQQEPGTPHSLSSVLVHAPASCAGVLLTGSTPGATSPQSKSPSALNTAELRQINAVIAQGAARSQQGARAALNQQGAAAAVQSVPMAGRAQAQAAACGGSGGCAGAGMQYSNSGSSLGSLLSSDMSEQQLELHHTGWTDDDSLHLGELRAQFNISTDLEHFAPDPTPMVLKSSPVTKWDETTECAVPPKHDPEHMQMKHLYKKVAELESGLLRLLSGSLITPAAAASLIASLNKIAASGVVNPLSSGGGAANGAATDNKLVETIQKAALAAAAASSNGGAPPFAVALGRLANSMGGKKSFSGSGSVRQKSFSGSSRSAGSSVTGQIASRKTDSSQAESQASVSQLRLDLSKVTSSSEPTATDTETDAPDTAKVPTNASTDSAVLNQQQPAQQQQQQQQRASADHMHHAAGVAMAMEVLAKAEERLKELHLQEERLKALWASRGSSAALLGRRSVSRKSSGQPETIQEAEQEQQHERDDKLSRANSAPASRAASSPGKTAGLLVVQQQQQQQQRKPSMDMRDSSLSRRVSFQDDYHRSVSYTEQESSDPGRSTGGKSCSSSQLMSPRGTEESSDKAAFERSFAGTESDAFSGCWSDDSADPSSRVRRLLSQQRRHRLKLKQQRSAGGTGCGYESAEELPVTSGGAYSESADEEFEEPGRYLLSHLHAFGTHRLLTPDRAYTSRASHHAALHSAPVTSGYSAASRRHLLLSVAAPERERSFDDVTAKAVARVRKNIAAGKPSRPFKARDVPAHVYESRYASIMNTREAAKALRAQTTAAAAAKQPGSYARGLSSPPLTSSAAHRSRTLGATTGSRHSGSPTPSKSVRVPGAATAAQMLASSTHSSAYSSMRNGSSAFGGRASAGRAAAAAAAKLPSSGRGAQKQAAKATCSDHPRHTSHSGALRGLDTVLETQVLRSNPTALLPAALKRAYAPYRASVLPSSSAAAASTVDAGRAQSPGRANATASSSYCSSGPRKVGKPAVTAAGAAGGYSTSMSGGTPGASRSSSSSSSSGAVRSTSKSRQHNNSRSATDEGLEYLTNLFTLKRACQATTKPQVQKHRAAVRQVEQASNISSRADEKETYLSMLGTAMRPSSRNRDRSAQSDSRIESSSDGRFDSQRRRPSPARYRHSHLYSSRDSCSSPVTSAGRRSSHSRSRPASVDGYSSGGGATEQLWPSGYSKLRSVSAERVRRSERSEVTRSVEGHSRLQSSTMQPRHSVDAGSYARHLIRHSVDTGGYASRLSVTDANRRSTVDTGASSSSSWKVHAAAAELERRIQQYRTGRASPLDRKLLY